MIISKIMPDFAFPMTSMEMKMKMTGIQNYFFFNVEINENYLNKLPALKEQRRVEGVGLCVT